MRFSFIRDELCFKFQHTADFFLHRINRCCFCLFSSRKNCFFATKTYKRQVKWTCIQNFKNLRRKLWQINPVQCDWLIDGQKHESWRTHLVTLPGLTYFSLDVGWSKYWIYFSKLCCTSQYLLNQSNNRLVIMLNPSVQSEEKSITAHLFSLTNAFITVSQSVI